MNAALDAPIADLRWPIKRPGSALKPPLFFMRAADPKRPIALGMIRPMAPKRVLAVQRSGNFRSSETRAVSCTADALPKSRRGGGAQLTLAHGQRQRHGQERDQHQHPKHVHIAEIRRRRLHLLPDPLNGLVKGLPQRAPLGDEIVRHLVQCILISDGRRGGLADQHVLMELLAVPQHIVGERDPDRAAGIARRVERGRSLIGLAGRNAFIRCGDDRQEN
jgi:hypothetical protein